MNANDGDRIRLCQLESVQYLAMADAEANTRCASGVQKNTMLRSSTPLMNRVNKAFFKYCFTTQ